MIEWIILILGLAGLWIGANLVIEGAQRIAKALKISELIIGLTVVSIGTSLPEIATILAAAFERLQGIETSGIAVGTIIGSNIANMSLILGFVGFFAVLKIGKRSLGRDGIMLFVSMLMLSIASLNGIISREEGVLLIVINLFYLLYLAKTERVLTRVRQRDGKSNPLIDFVMILAGLALVIYASDAVVSNGVLIARNYGVKEIVIGLMIGLGTSLPELTVSLNALLKGHTEISIGNLIGSNITNSMFILGIGAILSGWVVESSVLFFDIPAMAIITLLAIIFLYRKLDITKVEGVVLVLLYCGYMAARLFFI